MGFEDSVFINCPFDDEYHHILRPILFTAIYLGLKPRIALERSDSGEPRISKIIELIKASKYAIHDLSRLRANEAGEYFRLNMPFELGIDVGCRTFGSNALGDKRCLILEAAKYRYQAALSDLSGSDIAVHAMSRSRLPPKCATGWPRNVVQRQLVQQKCGVPSTISWRGITTP